MIRPNFAFTVVCTAYLLLTIGRASSTQPPAIDIDLHELAITWNKQPVAGYFALEQKCQIVRLPTSGQAVQILSGINTAPSQVARVSKFCGKNAVLGK